MRYVFFGSSTFSIHVLNELEKLNRLPQLIVTLPDSHQGRGRVLDANIVKKWALQRNIGVYTPEKLLDHDFIEALTTFDPEHILVASYGKIIPEKILDITRILNIHPSLLPHYRGPSPIQSMILNDEKNIGVTIMQIDEQMDHGPIATQENYTPPVWPMKEEILEKELAVCGARLYVETVSKEIVLREQHHGDATYTKKFIKEDGLLNLTDDRYKNYLKFCTFHRHPGCYFFDTHKGNAIRVKVTDAEYVDGVFVPKRVIPEGRKEMEYGAYLLGKKN